MVDPFHPARGSTLVRRLQVLLLAAAPLPLLLLLLISTRQYDSKLRSENERRLAARAKDSGLELYRRLSDLETDLRWASQAADQRTGVPLYVHPWRDRFHRLIRLEAGRLPPGTAMIENGPGGGWEGRLGAGQAVLLEARNGGQPALWLAVPAGDRGPGRLWGEIRLEWIWATGVLPVEGGQRWLLLGSRGRHLLAAAPVPAPDLVRRLRAVVDQGVGGIEFRGPDGHLWRARFVTIPLGHEFGHPGLVAVASEQDRLADEAAALRRTSWLVALGALLALVLVVGRRLRSHLEPISTLLRGTMSLARGDLTTRVEVQGARDLEQLGQGFNVMAAQLERSFQLLRAGNEVAAAALDSTPAPKQVAAAFVARVCRIAPAPIEPVVVLSEGDDRNLVVRGTTDGAALPLDTVGLADSVRNASGWVPLDEGRSMWRAIRHGKKIFGVVGLLGCEPGGPDRAFLEALDGPGSQLDLALSRVDSIAELDRANWGTLRALARAVDSASPWTRGHSERVAEISVAIGEELGLDSERLRTLRRGCLLHDVGKIGVPAAILDSPNRLTREEIEIVQSHVEKGARILEPVEGLQDVMPIVWQHHERLDGSGYPRGLKAAEIDPLSSLVAVADVFEATSASRPYRPAIDPEVCFAYLLERAGSQFDASCVEALGRARRKPGWPYPELATGSDTRLGTTDPPAREMVPETLSEALSRRGEATH